MLVKMGRPGNASTGINLALNFFKFALSDQ